MENFWIGAKLLGVDSTTATFPEWDPAPHGVCKASGAI